MEYFNISAEELISKGAINTAKEIYEQPLIWNHTYAKLAKEQKDISNFWNSALKDSKEIILTGAGTSAFIGYSLEGTFQRHTGITTVSIPTTHLVTHPEDYLGADGPILVISFARSGNSPESVAAVRQVDRICKNCYHLVITCDKDGQLANYKSGNKKYTFVLPPESNDKSLAMTSSYTSMLLTGLLLARFGELNMLKDQVSLLAKYGRTVLDEHIATLKEIAKLDFERAVFLGSGPLFGTATESHLKLQELTDGQIICKSDSFLAFRHGPKAVINEKSIVVFLFSNRESVQRYERDLVKSMRKGKKAMRLIGISEKPLSGITLDNAICFSGTKIGIEEEFLAVCSVLPAQILGLFKSLELGLKPDNPSVSGAISRVVEGVVIYEGQYPSMSNNQL
jgi:tagatose-6-phosphate ketose/aldose isomerase